MDHHETGVILYGVSLPLAVIDVAIHGIHSLGGLASLLLALAAIIRATAELIRILRPVPTPHKADRG